MQCFYEEVLYFYSHGPTTFLESVKNSIWFLSIKSSQFTQHFNANNWASTFKILVVLEFIFKGPEQQLQEESFS